MGPGFRRLYHMIAEQIFANYSGLPETDSACYGDREPSREPRKSLTGCGCADDRQRCPR